MAKMVYLEPDELSIKIRKAIIEDFFLIYDFICQLEETSFNKIAFKKIFIKNLKAKHIYYLVAEIEKSVVGFISIYIQPQIHHCANVAEIMELFVEKKFRNQKIGSALVKVAIKTAKKCNCDVIELATNTKRKDAHRFYEKENFERSHLKFTLKL